jgi:hypothetical protein
MGFVECPLELLTRLISSRGKDDMTSLLDVRLFSLFPPSLASLLLEASHVALSCTLEWGPSSSTRST